MLLWARVFLRDLVAREAETVRELFEWVDISTTVGASLHYSIPTERSCESSGVNVTLTK